MLTLALTRRGAAPLLAAARRPTAALQPLRSLAKKAEAKGAAKGVSAGPSATGPPPVGTINGLNILKAGPEIVVGPDSEYPDWVWTLHKPLPTLDQLQAMHQANPETMSEEDKKRMIRQWNRKRIKDSNALKAKK